MTVAPFFLNDSLEVGMTALSSEVLTKLFDGAEVCATSETLDVVFSLPVSDRDRVIFVDLATFSEVLLLAFSDDVCDGSVALADLDGLFSFSDDLEIFSDGLIEYFSQDLDTVFRISRYFALVFGFSEVLVIERFSEGPSLNLDFPFAKLLPGDPPATKVDFEIILPEAFFTGDALVNAMVAAFFFVVLLKEATRIISFTGL